MVFSKKFLTFNKLCDIQASQANLGELVKVFEDHLYFLNKKSGQISVLSYSFDRMTGEVTTKEEVRIRRTKNIYMTEI